MRIALPCRHKEFAPYPLRQLQIFESLRGQCPPGVAGKDLVREQRVERENVHRCIADVVGLDRRALDRQARKTFATAPYVPNQSSIDIGPEPSARAIA